MARGGGYRNSATVRRSPPGSTGSPSTPPTWPMRRPWPAAAYEAQKKPAGVNGRTETVALSTDPAVPRATRSPVRLVLGASPEEALCSRQGGGEGGMAAEEFLCGQGGSRRVGSAGAVHSSAGMGGGGGEVEARDGGLGPACPGHRPEDQLLVCGGGAAVDRSADHPGAANTGRRHRRHPECQRRGPRLAGPLPGPYRPWPTLR
jgi:hypothetical protein